MRDELEHDTAPRANDGPTFFVHRSGYDLMVVVEGGDLREVARFVSEKLSTLEGVLSTATHFRLKTYKENGFIFEKEVKSERLAVSP